MPVCESIVSVPAVARSSEVVHRDRITSNGQRRTRGAGNVEHAGPCRIGDVDAPGCAERQARNVFVDTGRRRVAQVAQERSLEIESGRAKNVAAVSDNEHAFRRGKRYRSAKAVGVDRSPAEIDLRRVDSQVAIAADGHTLLAASRKGSAAIGQGQRAGIQRDGASVQQRQSRRVEFHVPEIVCPGCKSDRVGRENRQLIGLAKQRLKLRRDDEAREAVAVGRKGHLASAKCERVRRNSRIRRDRQIAGGIEKDRTSREIHVARDERRQVLIGLSTLTSRCGPLDTRSSAAGSVYNVVAGEQNVRTVPFGVIVAPLSSVIPAVAPVTARITSGADSGLAESLSTVIDCAVTSIDVVPSELSVRTPPIRQTRSVEIGQASRGRTIAPGLAVCAKLDTMSKSLPVMSTSEPRPPGAGRREEGCARDEALSAAQG